MCNCNFILSSFLVTKIFPFIFSSPQVGFFSLILYNFLFCYLFIHIVYLNVYLLFASGAL